MATDRYERDAVTDDLVRQQSLATPVARDVADYVTLHLAAAIGLARQPGLAQLDPAGQHVVLQAMAGGYPDLFAFSTFDAAGQPLARSDAQVSLPVTGQPVYQRARATRAPAVANLLDNGLKYGGRPGVAARVEVGAIARATEWCVFVCDNGPGILAAYHEQAFRLFGRLPEGKRRDPSGTGVGLAAVKRAVRQLGGNVWIDSDPARRPGTTFWFTLPRSSGESKAVVSDLDSPSAEVPG